MREPHATRLLHYGLQCNMYIQYCETVTFDGNSYLHLSFRSESYIQKISNSLLVLLKKSALSFSLSLLVVKYDVLVEGSGL